MGDSNSFTSVLRQYGETTTVKGVPKVIKSRNYFLKGLWLVAVLFGASFATFQITTLVIRYLSYPSVTKVQNINEEPVFPDVTICNLNPLSDDMNSWTMEDYTYELWGLLNNDLHGLSPDAKRELKNGGNISKSEYNEIYQSISSIAGFFQNFPYTKDTIAYYSEKFITDCLFYDWEGSTLDIQCDDTTVLAFLNPYYYICFTIQVPEQYKNNVRGLSLVAYLDSTEHAMMPTFSPNIKNSKSNGVRVDTHPRNTLTTLTNGHSLGPGLESTITMSPVRIEKLPEPYGNCVTKKYLEYEENEELDMEKSPLKYTVDTCDSYCRQNIIIRECGCMDPMYVYTERQVKTDSEGFFLTPSCGDMQIEDPLDFNISGNVSPTTQRIDNHHITRYWKKSLCALRAKQLFEEECFCQDSCTQEYYEMSIAQAEWPLVDYQIAFYEKYIENSTFAEEYSYYGMIRDNYWSGNADMDNVVRNLSKTRKIQENFLQVNVLFDGRRVQLFSEVPALKWDSFFAFMGGGLNLWIGISFMTLIELVELVYKLLPRCDQNSNESGDSSSTRRNVKRKKVTKVTINAIAPADN